MSYRRERGREREINADDPFTHPDFMDKQETSWRRQRSSNGSVQSFSSVGERQGHGEQDYPRGQSHHGEELVRGGDSSCQRGKSGASDHRSQDGSWKERLQFHGRPPDQPHHRRTGSDGYSSTRPSHEDKSWRDSRSSAGSPRYSDKNRSDFHEGKRDWSPRALSEDSLESHGSSLHGKPSSSVESGELLDRRRRDARREGRSEQAQVSRRDRDLSPRAPYRGHSPLSERSSARSQRSERSAGSHVDDWDSRRDQPSKGPTSSLREMSRRIDEPRRNYSPSRDGRRSSSRDRSPRNDAKSTRSNINDYVIPRKQVVAPNPPQPTSPLPSSPPRSQRPASGSAPVDPRRRRGRPAPRSNDRPLPVPSRSAPFTHNAPLLGRNTSPGSFRDAAIVSGENFSGEKRILAVPDESRRSGALSQSSDNFKSVESDTGDGGYGATARKEFMDHSNVAEDDAQSSSDSRYLQTGRDRKTRGGEGPPRTVDEDEGKGVDGTESDIERTYTDMIPPSIRAGREPWQNTPVPVPPMGLSIQSITLGGGEEDAPRENPLGIHGVHVRLPLRHQHPTVDPELIPRRSKAEDSMQNLAQRHAPASQSHPPAAFGGGAGGYSEYDHGTQVQYPPAPQPLQSVHQSQPPWFDNQRASGAGSTYSDTCRNIEGGFQNGVSVPSTMHSPPVKMAPHPEGFRPLDGAQPNSLYTQDGNTNSFLSLPDTNRGATGTNNGTDSGATGAVVQVPSDRRSPLPATPQQYPVIQHQAPSQSVPQHVTSQQSFQEQQGYWGGGNTDTSGISSGSHVATMAPALGQTWSHSNVTGSSMMPAEMTWTKDMRAGAGAGVDVSGGPSTIPIQGGQSCPASSHTVGALGGEVVSQQGIEGGTCEHGVVGPMAAVREENPVIAAAATSHSAQANHDFKGEFHPATSGPATSGPASMIDSTNGSFVASASHADAASSSCGAGDAAGPTPAGRQRLAPTPLARTEWSLADLARRFPRLTIPESLIYVVASWVTLDSRSIGVVPLLCQPVLREDEDAPAPDRENTEQDLTKGGQEEEKRGESSAGEEAGRGAELDVVDGHTWEVRVLVPYGLGAEAASGCWGEAFRLALVPSEVAASSSPSPEEGDGHQERDSVDEEGHATYPGSGASGKLLIALPGGVWDPERDGKDVEADDNVALIRTAIRTSKALSGVDLSCCSCWLKFCELYYDGRTTIVFLCGDGVRVAPEDAPRNVTVATISELVFGDLRKAQGRNSAAERELELELEATFEARLCAEFLWGLVSRDWAGVVLDSLRTHAASLERMKSKNLPSAHPMDELSPSAASTAADSGAQRANEPVSESAQGDTGKNALGSRERVSSAEMSTEAGGAEAKGSAGGARSSAADAALSVMETPAEVRAAFGLFDLEGQGWVAGDRLEAWLLDAGFRLSTRYLKSLLSSVCSAAEAGKNLLFEYRSRLVLSDSGKEMERGVEENPLPENGGAPGEASDDTDTAADGTVAPGPGVSTGASVTADKAPAPATSERETTSGGDSVDEGACPSAAPGKISTATTEDTGFIVGSDEAKTPGHDHRGPGAKDGLPSMPASIEEPESSAIREDASVVAAAKKDSASIPFCSSSVTQVVTASVEESTSTSGNSSQTMKEVASSARGAGATPRPSKSTEKSGSKAIKGDVPAPGGPLANSNTVEKNPTAPKVAAATVPARSTFTPTSTYIALESTSTVSTRNAATKRTTSTSTASKRSASEIEDPSGQRSMSGSSVKSAKTHGKGSVNTGAKRSTPTSTR